MPRRLLAVVALWLLIACAPDGPPSTPTAREGSPTGCALAWRPVAALDPALPAPTLRAIAARAADNIWIVGSYSPQGYTQPLTMHWDGQRWTVLANPGFGSNAGVLTGLAILAADDVWAVGTDDPRGALIKHWDGRAWQPLAVPVSGPQVRLAQVAGTAPDDVWAVGSTGAFGAEQTLILHWDGVRWQPVPSPHPDSRSDLQAISARTRGDAWAGGGFGGGHLELAYALTLHWDGTAWQHIATPGQNGWLTSVAALAAADVWAVGRYSGLSGAPALLLHWAGARWQAQDPPGEAPRRSWLTAIHARTAADLWAVGYLYPNAGPGGTIPWLLHWDGSAWQSGNAGAVPADNWTLNDVAPLSDEDVWAIGSRPNLVLHYSRTCAEAAGTPPPPTAHPSPTPAVGALGATPTPVCGLAWRETALPAAEQRIYALGGPGSSDLWAVGQTAGRAYAALVTHWDGARWTSQALPPLAPASALLGVAVLGAQDVWAVGWQDATIRQALILHWDGAAWRAVPAPTGGRESQLRAIAGAAPNDLWAVGTARARGQARDLVLHWDGRAWQEVPGVDLGEQTEQLAALAVVAPDDLWAAGTHSNDATHHPLLEHWDGTRWSVPGNLPDRGRSEVSSLAARTPNDVWAAGSAGLLWHWDGSSWLDMAGPLPAPDTTYVIGGTPRPAAEIVVAGFAAGPPDGPGALDRRGLGAAAGSGCGGGRPRPAGVSRVRARGCLGGRTGRHGAAALCGPLRRPGAASAHRPWPTLSGAARGAGGAHRQEAPDAGTRAAGGTNFE